MRSRSAARVAAAVASVVLVAVPATAAAQPARAPAKAPAGPGPGPAPAKLRPILSDLASSDVGKVRHAIGELQRDPSPYAAKALEAFVRRGPPGPALVPAIRAIGSVHRPESIGLLVDMTRHRRADARVAAAEGLSNYRDPRAAAALAVLLSDPDADVRGAAASSLSTAGTRANVGVLFRALERHIDEAALGIGKLGNAEEVSRLAGMLGRLPLETLLPGLEAAILRADLSAAARVEIVRKLGALQTPEVKEFLERVRLAVPTAAVREAMQAEAARIAG